MAMVMYLFTCGFVCDNSNVYSTCNIHTDSKCITYNNSFTSKHYIVTNVHESQYSASASAFINHSLNPAKRPLSGGTQRNTAKRLYAGTRCVVVVTGYSNKMLRSTYMRVYNCARDHKMRLMQLFPLGLHSHGMTATHLFEREVLQGCCKKKKNVQGDSFWTTEDAVAHWPRLDVCRPRLARNLNSRSCFARDSLAGRFVGPASGRKGCIDQEDDVLFLPLPPCCSMQSHKYTRGKRKTFQSFTGQPQRHSTRQNEGNQNAVS